MFSERTSVGLDVHARTTTAWALDGVTGEVFSELAASCGRWWSCAAGRYFRGVSQARSWRAIWAAPMVAAAASRTRATASLGW
jgi:hypothetical protein